MKAQISFISSKFELCLINVKHILPQVHILNIGGNVATRGNTGDPPPYRKLRRFQMVIFERIMTFYCMVNGSVTFSTHQSEGLYAYSCKFWPVHSCTIRCISSLQHVRDMKKSLQTAFASQIFQLTFCKVCSSLLTLCVEKCCPCTLFTTAKKSYKCIKSLKAFFLKHNFIFVPRSFFMSRVQFQPRKTSQKTSK